MSTEDTIRAATPPPVIACARVLSYAIIDESVQFVGRTNLYVDGKQVGCVPCLAICQKFDEDEALLFHCDEQWDVLGSSRHDSVDEAKRRAEGIYTGISALWTDVLVSHEEAEAFLNKAMAQFRCAFCRRRPDQIRGPMYGNNSEETFICGECVEGFHSRLHDPSSE